MKMIAPIMIAALAFSGASRSKAGASARPCSAVSFTAKLDAGNSFAKKVGGLEFKIRAAHGNGLCDGWTFTLEDASGNDYIYPVNMPLRFNPSQFLGCSYGLTAKHGLEMKRSLRFVLTGQDYLRLNPLMKNALWPGDSPDPDHAAKKYLRAISTVRTGLLRLKTLHYQLSPDGRIRSATFRVELITPASFHFQPDLKPHPTNCPAAQAQ